jgi:hypothetical protein
MQPEVILFWFCSIWLLMPCHKKYFQTIIPCIIMLLSHDFPIAYRRAAAFAVSRMLGTDPMFSYKAMTSAIVLRILHLTFRRRSSNELVVSDIPALPSSELDHMTPTLALSRMVTLVTNADPSPALISTLLSPIAPDLYALMYHLDQVKTSDPSLKASLNGLLSMWGRLVSLPEGVDVLWTVLDCTGDDWQVDIDGEISRSEK